MASMTITGKAYWARVQPDQLHDNYNGDGREWSLDVSVDEATVQKLTKAGLGPKIKDKGGDRGQYITFTRNELKAGGPKAGEPNNPIVIVDEDDEPFTLPIGNGSLISVDFNVFQTVWKNKTYLKPAILKIIVHDWVEYKTTQTQAGPRKAKAGDESWDSDAA